MIEQRTLDLIHAELDGELHVGDLAELQRRLEIDPEARAMHEQLARMAGSLGRLAPEAPPADLQQRILEATRPVAKVLPFRDRRAQFVRYTMALAAGIAIAAVGIRFAGTSGPGLEADQLVGTMGWKAVEPETMVSEIALRASGLKGSVGLSPGEDGWLLVFDLASEQPVKVSTMPGGIEFMSQGAHRRVLALAPGVEGPLRISFEGQGKLLQEAVVEVPEPASSK